MPDAMLSMAEMAEDICADGKTVWVAEELAICETMEPTCETIEDACGPAFVGNADAIELISAAIEETTTAGGWLEGRPEARD